VSPAQVGADIGGTFTDLLWRGEDGSIRVDKRLSRPDDYSGAIVAGLASLAGSDSLEQVTSFSHATTVATNAVLEGTGGRVALITTRGFRDVLELGRLQRADLYDLMWQKSEPLVPRERRFEVGERIAADGSVLVELDEESLAQAVAEVAASDVDAVAICLVNSYVNPAHERRVAEVLRATHPRLDVVVSTDLLRDAGEFERASTAVVNAYLQPVVSRYLRELVARLQEHDCRAKPSIMQSSGGTIAVAAAPEVPVRVIESGPAAGVIAAAALARERGITRAISFDMGGTTAKACLIEDFEPSLSQEYWVGGDMSREGSRLLRGKGMPIRVPSMDIAEVSSGGGSIAWLDAGNALHLGPRSAGATPGPACYGLGGEEPTFTDACVVLGILGRETIGVGGLTLRPELAEEAIRTRIAEPLGIDVREAACGIYRVAISNLMRAIRAVTVDVGKDPAQFTMIAFGGGGGMVAAPLASALGIEQVVVPRMPGAFSALGLLAAAARRDTVRGVFRDLSSGTLADLGQVADELGEEIVEQLVGEGHVRGQLLVRRWLDVHYRGQSSSLSIEWRREAGPEPGRECDSLREDFRGEYARLHDHLRDDEEIEVTALHVSVEGRAQAPSFGEIVGELAGDGAQAPAPTGRTLVDPLGGEAEDGLALGDRRRLAGLSHVGAVVLDEPDATVFVPGGWSRAIDAQGTLVLEGGGDPARAPRSAEVDSFSLEVFRNWLGSLNDELTATIARTAQSEIAKDTLDFATAICDTRGRVVSQGLTMVLHAGSIPAAIERLLAEFGEELRPGDAFLSNDPYLAGGSHLPDVYVITPIFAAGEWVGFAGCVCHVADMGGRVPGGNAADSREIFAEGLRLPPVRLAQDGVVSHAVESILRANVRVPEKVLGDVHSLLNACRVAERRIEQLVEREGAESVRRHMDAVLDHGAALFRERIELLPEGSHSFRDVLDGNGVAAGSIEIQVTVERRGDRLVVDFAGTDPQVEGATNAPICFTESAVYYVAKAVLGPDIPDNSGYFDLVDVVAHPGSVVNPVAPAATGAKGVTAFRIVDTLFGAFAQALPGRVPAAGDGGATIVALGGNEGGRAFVLVDVIMSAWGGRPGADGVDGISSAASNGRNTPVEVIEAAYPVRVLAYELVADTGGAGRWRGGLATRRVFEYVGAGAATLQVRSDRNPTRPWGVLGGEPGSISGNLTIAPGGERTARPSKFTAAIEPGTIFVHQTAGSGGYGLPTERGRVQVEADMRAGKLSPEAARRDYGVASPEFPTTGGAATADALVHAPATKERL
jgi:N-methylhydantoinase A/oxoprolinase/acetone carboxylase beta subunit/N-methylhydantoinase B/oxoprolinase/acetone carboxylase alpha subunit